MENLTFNFRDIAFLAALICSLWAVYKVVIEIQEPRKALEKRVDALDAWHKEDHERIKKTEKMDKLILEGFLTLLEHELTGNGDEDIKKIQHKINDFLKEGYYD